MTANEINSVKLSDIDPEEKLNIVIEALVDVTGQLEELKELINSNHEETCEKLDNVSRPGADWGIENES